jgi:hypothetical protein
VPAISQNLGSRKPFSSSQQIFGPALTLRKNRRPIGRNILQQKGTDREKRLWLRSRCMFVVWNMRTKSKIEIAPKKMQFVNAGCGFGMWKSWFLILDDIETLYGLQKCEESNYEIHPRNSWHSVTSKSNK